MLPSDCFLSLQSSPGAAPYHGIFSVSQARPLCDNYNTVGEMCMLEQVQQPLFIFDESHQQTVVLPERDHFRKMLTFDEEDFGISQCTNAYTFVCGNGLECVNIVANCFITKFSKAGAPLSSIKVFSKLSDPDVFSWYGVLNAFLENGQEADVISTYYQMYQSRTLLDGHVFRLVLKACANVKALVDGRIIHAHMVECGVDCNVYAASTLIDMYLKCGNIGEARAVFEDLPSHDLVTWSTMLAGYARHGLGQEAFELFHEMQEAGWTPGEVTYVSVLKACSSISSLRQGQLTHANIVCSGFEANVYLINTLIYMYAECGCFDSAKIVFARRQSTDLGTWNAMLGACAQYGYSAEALHLFYCMQDEGPNPGVVTFVNVLKACAISALLNEGMHIHADAIKRGFDTDILIESTLVGMYAKCKHIQDAHAVFNKIRNPNAVTWAILMSGYAECGLGMEAFMLLEDMKRGDTIIDQGIMVSLVKTCTNSEMQMQGYISHALAVEYNLEYDAVVGNGLITMYVTCGCTMDASVLFNRLPMRNTMTWNAFISGLTLPSDDLTQNAHRALTIFYDMVEASVRQDTVTFISILKACSILLALNNGSLVHAHAVEAGLASNILVGNALINMYIKCGDLHRASLAFNKLLIRDSVTYNVMIDGFGKSSRAKEAILFFEKMQDDEIRVDEVTFISLLSACSHAALRKEGCYYFNLMKWVYGISPQVDHCNLMVDLLGRVGSLPEAEDFLHTMPCQTDIAGWMSLLTHCRNHADIELGLQCFGSINALDPGNASSYVLMSSIYSRSGMWADAERLEKLRRTTQHAVKMPAKACIEVGDKIHEFTVGDTSHPEIDEVYKKLEDLIPRLKAEGYEPNLNAVPHLRSDDDKEAALCGHSEKLAIAFGLMNTCEGMSIRVSKNLRVCSDCHAAVKILSKIEKREIVVVDTYHIHHFSGGDCSCQDLF